MALESALPMSSGGMLLVVVMSIFLFIDFLAVGARFYARSLQRKSIWVDDYLIIVGLFFTVATIISGYILVVNGGEGRHITELTPGEITVALKLFMVAPITWITATCLIKSSILFFYVSIFTMPRLRWAVYTLITLTAILFIVVVLEAFLICRPLAFNWDKTIPGGVCGSTKTSFFSAAIINLFIDLSICILPMPILWGLQMALKKKLAIMAILGLGLIICGFSAARLKGVLLINEDDFTFSTVADLILAALEIELGIINACLPILRPVFLKIFGSDSGQSTTWSKKSTMDPEKSGWNSQKGTLASKNFHRLDEDMYPLGEMPVTARAHTDSDLENQPEMTHPGNVMVKKDIYVYRSPTEPAAGVV